MPLEESEAEAALGGPGLRKGGMSVKSVGAFWIFARAIERASDTAHLNNKKAIAAVGSR